MLKDFAINQERTTIGSGKSRVPSSLFLGSYIFHFLLDFGTTILKISITVVKDKEPVPRSQTHVEIREGRTSYNKLPT